MPTTLPPGKMTEELCEESDNHAQQALWLGSPRAHQVPGALRVVCFNQHSKLGRVKNLPLMAGEETGYPLQYSWAVLVLSW